MGINTKNSSAISIHDLKCGNILYYDTEEGSLPTTIDWQDIKFLSEEPDEFNLRYHPIPLTEQWLAKFGFSDAEYKDGYTGKDFKSGTTLMDFVLQKPGEKGKWNKTYTMDMPHHRFLKLDFVHELQNLYYSIVEDMLSIN